MASIRQHPKSQFYFVRFRDENSGKWVEKSTGIKAGISKNAEKAERLRRQYATREAIFKTSPKEHFQTWVQDFIDYHYTNKHTHTRMTCAWIILSRWLREEDLRHPNQVKHEHVQEYLKWRRATAEHNTARLELKFLSFLLNEAVLRDYCVRNVLDKSKVPRQEPPEKPELTDTQFIAAREAFTNNPRPDQKWMRSTFEIMAHVGCRFAETSIDWKLINLEKKEITMTDSKRNANDPKKFYIIPISDQLCDYLRPLKEAWEKAMKAAALTVPVLTSDMNQRFNEIMKRATGTTSHSLRVSFITRCHRASLTEAQAMKLVNHSSQLVHRIYTRLGTADAHNALALITQPPAPPGDTHP